MPDESNAAPLCEHCQVVKWAEWQGQRFVGYVCVYCDFNAREEDVVRVLAEADEVRGAS
jgi:hypothetical protein